MNFCIFDVITYSRQKILQVHTIVVIWWIFVSLMWLHTAWVIIFKKANCCDLMNFCIFDVITYSGGYTDIAANRVVIWWIFVSLMWLHTADRVANVVISTLWFDEFLYLWCDYIQHTGRRQNIGIVVIWWIFVSLMWLHTAVCVGGYWWNVLWFDEFLYLWCDYIQLKPRFPLLFGCCDLMNFCIFDVITYS